MPDAMRSLRNSTVGAQNADAWVRLILILLQDENAAEPVRRSGMEEGFLKGKAIIDTEVAAIHRVAAWLRELPPPRSCFVL